MNWCGCGVPGYTENFRPNGVWRVMKILVLASALLAMIAAPAFAGCAEGLKELDGAVQSAEITPDMKAQIQDMRAQAEKLCSAGNDEEAADVIAEAEAMLSAEAQ